MRYLTYIITVPLTVFSALFAFSNTDMTTLSLWPGDETFSYTAPMWAFGLGLLGGGFFLGALFVSILHQKARFRYWRQSRRLARLEKEIDAARADAAMRADMPQDAKAALPKP